MDAWRYGVYQYAHSLHNFIVSTACWFVAYTINRIIYGHLEIQSLSIRSLMTYCIDCSFVWHLYNKQNNTWTLKSSCVKI